MKLNSTFSCLVLLFVLLVGTSMAQERETYTVKPGDTLFSIAQAHEVSVDELRRLNELEGGSIRAGMLLLIREASEELHVQGWNGASPDSTATPADSLASPGDSLGAVADGPIPGTVRILENSLAEVVLGDGETLYSLALQFAVVPDTLLSLNPALPEVLREGDMVIVPADRTTRRVTVRTGDTLFSLARRFDVGVAVIRSANEMASDNIRVGQTLTIPSSRVEFGASGAADLPEFETIPAFVYPDTYNGRMMAGGRSYDRDDFLMSHPDLPMDSIVLLKMGDTGRSVFAVVADRGPIVEPRSIEISARLADELGMEKEGASVTLHLVH